MLTTPVALQRCGHLGCTDADCLDHACTLGRYRTYGASFTQKISMIKKNADKMTMLSKGE